MKNSSIPALVILIAIAFIALPVAVSEAQNAGIASAMKGHRLHNLWGEDLGRINGVTFDDNGQPAFIILSVMDNKIVTIPFSALLPSSGRDRFVVNISKRQVRNMPGYSISEGNNFLICYGIDCPNPE